MENASFAFFPHFFFKHNTCKTHFRSRRAKSQEPAVAPGVRLCRCMFHTQPHVCAFDFLCTVWRLLYLPTCVSDILCILRMRFTIAYERVNHVSASIFCILCILVQVTLSSKMHASASWLLRQSYFLAQVMASINGQACWRLWNHASSDPHACRMLYSNNNTLCETRGEWGTDAYSTHHRIPPPPAENGCKLVNIVPAHKTQLTCWQGGAQVISSHIQIAEEELFAFLVLGLVNGCACGTFLIVLTTCNLETKWIKSIAVSRCHYSYKVGPYQLQSRVVKL